MPASPPRARLRSVPLLAALAALIAFGCGSGGPGAIAGCEPDGALTPVCGFRNPEDIAALPGGSWLAISQFPGMAGEGGGSLVAFRPTDGRRHTLFPDATAEAEETHPHGEASERWGDAACPGPPDPERFGPHGIDVDRDSHRMAVVNHGEREAVELFEIGHSRRGLALVWRGCVPLPDDVLANDVALLADGGFVVTNMMGRSGVARLLSMARMLFGADTGNVMSWQPGEGLRAIAGSEGSLPNGIAATPGGEEVFFAEWAGRRVVSLRRDASGAVVERRAVEVDHHPDNITWTRNGELLVTGQAGPIGEVLACGSVDEGTCALAFSVVELGSGTLDQRTVLDHDGSVQGAGTVALELGDSIWIGTFAGDRIARAAYRR